MQRSRSPLRTFIWIGAILIGTACAPLAAVAQGEAACRPGAAPTPKQTEGPFFKAGSPERADLIEPGMPGQPIEVTGLVLTPACRPVAGARVDLWQADNEGAYDNRGYRLRGHVMTDAEGRYRFRTIVPGGYQGRTRHLHIKISAPGARSTLTTQLYFPDDAAMNRSDGLFRRELVMRVEKASGDLAGRFDFIVDAGGS